MSTITETSKNIKKIYCSLDLVNKGSFPETSHYLGHEARSRGRSGAKPKLEMVGI